MGRKESNQIKQNQSRRIDRTDVHVHVVCSYPAYSEKIPQYLNQSMKYSDCVFVVNNSYYPKMTCLLGGCYM